MLVAPPAYAQLWTGATSTDWATASNWSTNSVPNSSAFVVVGTGVDPSPANQPLLTNGLNNTVTNLTIGAAINGPSLGIVTVRFPGVGLTVTGITGVGSSAGSTGSLRVFDGAAFNTIDLIVGNFGNGTVSVVNAGTVQAQNPTNLGLNAGSSGTVNVTGASSVFQVNDSLDVGVQGIGKINVAGGGSALVAGAFTLGTMSVGSGTVTATGLNSALNAGFMTIGRDGQGRLTVDDNATVTSQSSVHIGDGSTANGVLTVSNGGFMRSLADIAIGIDGAGSMQVQAGGVVRSVTGAIAVNSGSIGTISIDGAGSNWGTSGDLTLGGLGAGTLTISNGGTLTTGSSVSNASAYVGYGDAANISNAANIATITGNSPTGSSTWMVFGTLTVGHYADGQLNVSNGGQVTTTGDAFIGARAGSTGVVTVAGAGSNLTIGKSLFVGADNFNAGNGFLVVRDGGTVTAGDVNGAAIVYVGMSGTTSAFLNIGDGQPTLGSSFAAPGKLDVAEVFLGQFAQVNFSHTGNNYTFAPMLSGVGTIGLFNGTTILTADSSAFGGATVVGGGTLVVNGKLGGTAAVQSGGSLGGAGTLTGAVSVANGGKLLGVQGQTLTIGSLALSGGSNVDVSLGAPGTVSLFKVSGNLTLDGTLNVTDAGGFGAGVYRIIDYGGALNDNGMVIGTMPSGTSGVVQTAVANQVNLVVNGPGGTIGFFNGTTTVADGTIHGGSGTWSAGPSTNWTDVSGATAFAWGGNFAVFQNNPGNVTVDGSVGDVKTTGMQFIGQGWAVSGDPITLNGAGGSTTIRVGDGTAAGANSNAAIASKLTGASRLVKDDLGTLTLTADNTYAGGTWIKAGTLKIGDGTGTGSILGNVLNDGKLLFDRGGSANALTVDGTISGNGFVRAGSGAVVFTADNVYTGSTRIDPTASLSLGNGGTTGSIVGDVVNNGSLAFNRSNDWSLGGVVSGSGNIRQIGSGKTELTGDSSGFAGAAKVENGILAVNGKLGGAMHVWTTGRLQGIGTVGDTVVSGTIAPGNSIGTMNVAGNITFHPGSIYEVEVNAAGQSDRIVASGAAAINGGSVKVLAGMGNYSPATTYTILTANGGRTGAFTEGVTSNLAFLDPSLTYDANNVYLTMTRNTVSFTSAGITRNQIATGGGVESLGWANPVYNALLNLSADQAQYAFDQFSGEIHASARTALIEDSRFVRNAVNDRIRAAFDGVGASEGGVVTYVDGKPVPVSATTDRLAVWGQGFGSWGHTDGDGNSATLNRKTGGFFVGADAPVFDTWRFGAVVGYSRTDFDVKSRHSSGASDNYHLGLYGGTQWDDLAFRTGAVYTWHDVSTSRNVIFPGFGNSLKGDYNAATAQVFGELAYRFSVVGARFEPFANLAYVNLRTDGFAERGGGAALTSPSSDTDATFTTLGLRASTTFDMGGATLTAKGMLGWRHAFGDVTPLSTMRFAGGGDAFSIGGVPIARDAAVIEAGLDYVITPNTTLGVTYGGQFAAGMADQSVKASFNVRF